MSRNKDMFSAKFGSSDEIHTALDNNKFRFNFKLKKLALDNHLTTGDHIDAALNDHDENVRKYAINHESATKEHYHKALNDVHASVRTIAQDKLDGMK